MEVKILSITKEPLSVMYTAARTCYSQHSPQEIIKDYTPKKAEELVTKVLDSGHLSVAEHCSVTVAIDGIDRATANQLVRHRHCTFSQRSMRYCKIQNSIESIEGYIENAKNGKPFLLQDLCETYFVVDKSNIELQINYAQQLIEYLRLTEAGVKAEDARSVLPLATKTSLVMTCNFRELMHICNLRLCTRAQKPIREMISAVAKLVVKQEPFMKKYLVPSCEVRGFCFEGKCCGRKPKLEDIMRDHEDIEDLRNLVAKYEDEIRERNFKELHEISAEILEEEYRRETDVQQ